ncbi:MAG: glycosyltransferase family 1 protein [Minicystis sp.]
MGQGHTPLSIALVTETWSPEINGVAMTLGRLVDGLRRRGHRVEVVRPRQAVDRPGADHGSSVLRDSLPIPRYTGLRLGLPSGAVLEARWRFLRPDLVHIATEGPLGLSALRVARRLEIPVTSGFHTNFHDYSRHYGLGLLHAPVMGYLRWFHNRTKATLVPTRAQVRELAGAGFRNAVDLGRGVDAALYHPGRRDEGMRQRWGATERTVVCLHVGRVAPEKDIPLALDGWRAIRAAGIDTRMVVAGDGPERERLAASLPDALFTGALPRDELATAYASADLFLFPSRSETFGNVLLEAMASGIPAVSFDYAAPQIHVRHGMNGWLAPFGDRGAWIASAVAAAGDQAALRACGLAARETAAAVSWDSIIQRLELIFHRAIDTRSILEAA